jgi:hypothetical protein
MSSASGPVRFARRADDWSTSSSGQRRRARTGETGDQSGGLRLSVVDEPSAGDRQVPDAQGYLQLGVAPMLEDKVLDADVSGEQIRFSVRE